MSFTKYLRDINFVYEIWFLVFLYSSRLRNLSSWKKQIMVFTSWSEKEICGAYGRWAFRENPQSSEAIGDVRKQILFLECFSDEISWQHQSTPIFLTLLLLHWTFPMNVSFRNSKLGERRIWFRPKLYCCLTFKVNHCLLQWSNFIWRRSVEIAEELNFVAYMSTSLQLPFSRYQARKLFNCSALITMCFSSWDFQHSRETIPIYSRFKLETKLGRHANETFPSRL